MSKYDEMRKELKHSIIDLDADHYKLSEFIRVIDEVFVKYRSEIEQPTPHYGDGWIYCGDKANFPRESGEYKAIVSDYEIFAILNFDKEDNTWFDKDGDFRNVIAWKVSGEN